MKYGPLKYSLKIWTTIIILGPLLMFAIKAFNKDCGYCDLKEYFWATIGVIMAFFLLFPLMLLTVVIIRKRLKNVGKKKLTVILSLTLLTIAYLLIGEITVNFFSQTFAVNLYSVLFDIIFPAIVGGSAWFYNLDSVSDGYS